MRDKTEALTPEGSEPSRPFFARFLEGQDSAEVCSRTLKYPSDRDEIDQRHHYLSNGEEGAPRHN